MSWTGTTPGRAILQRLTSQVSTSTSPHRGSKRLTSIWVKPTPCLSPNRNLYGLATAGPHGYQLRQEWQPTWTNQSWPSFLSSRILLPLRLQPSRTPAGRNRHRQETGCQPDSTLIKKVRHPRVTPRPIRSPTMSRKPRQRVQHPQTVFRPPLTHQLSRKHQHRIRRVYRTFRRLTLAKINLPPPPITIPTQVRRTNSKLLRLYLTIHGLAASLAPRPRTQVILCPQRPITNLPNANPTESERAQIGYHTMKILIRPLKKWHLHVVKTPLRSI